MARYEKFIQEIKGMNLVELAEFVKEIETTFGVSAAMVGAAAAPVAAEAPAAAEEKLEYKVTLKESGTDKIKVIKALRAVTNPPIGLTDAKKAVEEAPTVLGDFPKEQAKKMKQELEAAGAKVELS